MYDRLSAAIAATAPAARQALLPTIYRALAEGGIAEAEAEALDAICRPAPRPARAVQPRRRPAPRSPDRQASLERRRRCAASGALPPAIAASFTTGEQAVLAIIAAEVRARGACLLPMDAIAARAGVCRRTAMGALRRAERMGLLRIEERRLSAYRCRPNRITVIAAEWLAWLKLGRAQGGKFPPRTNTRYYFSPPGAYETTSPAAKNRPGGGRERTPQPFRH